MSDIEKPTSNPTADLVILGVTAGLTLFVFAGVAWATQYEQSHLWADCDALRSKLIDKDPTLYLTYAAAMIPYSSFALARNSAVFLSFVLVLVGAMFVLTQARVDFSATHPGTSLTTNSPGLVIATIGALLAWTSLQRSANVEMHLPSVDTQMEPARVDPTGGGR